MIGAILIRRMDVRPFTDNQIELVQNFATQAVIAIENTRLFNEQRESLQQQTATADVLKVISRSTFDLQTILNTLVKSATRLCSADRGILFRREDETYKSVAHYGYSLEFQQFHESHPITPGRGTAVGRAALEGKAVHIPDVLADPEYTFLDAQKLGRYRANLAVPLLREGKPIGGLSLTRAEPQAFTEKQIELVETFADQAVIAIENARLLNELRQRTHDLSESLQQQTATAEVLRVISSSPAEAQPAFDAMVARAAQLCEAEFSAVARFDDGLLHLVAMNNLSPAERESFNSLFPRRPQRNFAMGRAFLDGVSVQFEDVLADPTYDAHTRKVLQRALGYRSFLAVPIIRDGQPIGVIGCGRRKVRPFTATQIALVQTFADQALIAIENARLFQELRHRTDDLAEALEQQTATSEVLKVISSSPGELEPVFEAMLKNAVQICGAGFGNLFLREGDVFRIGATYGAPPAYIEYLRSEQVFQLNPKLGLGLLVKTKEIYRVADVVAAPTHGEELREAAIKLAGARTHNGDPNAEGHGGDRRNYYLPPRGRPFHRQTGRGARKTSPRRPSSQLRTRDCSTSCARHLNVKPQPQKCSKSSPARLATWIPCSRRFSLMPLNCVMRHTARFGCGRTTRSAPRCCMATYQTPTLTSGEAARFSGQIRMCRWRGSPLRASPSRSRTCVRVRPTAAAIDLL